MISEEQFHNSVLAYDGIYIDENLQEGLRGYRDGTIEGDLIAVVYKGTNPLRISLRCDTKLSKLLREKYETVLPDRNLNKKYWNTIICTGQIPEDEVFDLLRLSYFLTTKKSPLDT